jgi:hypothetical protein
LTYDVWDTTFDIWRLTLHLTFAINRLLHLTFYIYWLRGYTWNRINTS